MDIMKHSRLLEKRVDPALYEFRDHVASEIIVGLRGIDEFRNETIKYVTGIVGYEGDSRIDVGLYEVVDIETGKGLANKVLSLNVHTPIVEALFPMKVISKVHGVAGVSNKEITDLTCIVNAEPHNPNSRTAHTYRFRSKT
ncbi:hypothetical protein COU60_02870 [Candidatus Pacearchaeota archaeon CG10_big_fil_rev_8_21_14_0_10_34_76]|nr:MAG: hypothetical protein COU60_02870 [Candidatus Pacearchaeota archaeon CG10_big_fil_rev_8_21_14_0_10_34_76]